MSNQSMNEKEEKEKDEKRDETEEKELQKRDEKSVEEKHRDDPLSSITWAVILIWAGLVFLADNLGWLQNIPVTALPDGVHILGKLEAWTVIMLGAGVILLINVVARLLIPAYRSPVRGTIILAAVFIGIGLGNMVGWNVVWPIVLIAIGLSFLVGGGFRRK
jgi:hypothetical protein